MPLAALLSLSRLLPALVLLMRAVRDREEQKVKQESLRVARMLYEASQDRHPTRRASALRDLQRRQEPLRAPRKPRRFASDAPQVKQEVILG